MSRYVMPGPNLDGVEIVWRPFLLFPAQKCVGCGNPITAKDKPAFWAGRQSKAPMSFWHGTCYDGEFVVNARDKHAYEVWKEKNATNVG